MFNISCSRGSLHNKEQTSVHVRVYATQTRLGTSGPYSFTHPLVSTGRGADGGTDLKLVLQSFLTIQSNLRADSNDTPGNHSKFNTSFTHECVRTLHVTIIYIKFHLSVHPSIRKSQKLFVLPGNGLNLEAFPLTELVVGYQLGVLESV